MEREKFHGRVKGRGGPCHHAGCPETGEFRAPGSSQPGFDGPGDYRWFCLAHIREFNARYDWFAGMSREQIEAAQMPAAGWAESRVYRAASGVDVPPRWADFADPLDAISARFRQGMSERSAAAGSRFPPEERRALATLGLDEAADRRALRSAYSALVRRYHPDRNGGDRRHEKKLQQVVEAYQLLRSAPAFS